MSKFYEASDEIVELAQKEFERVGLAQMGLDLRVISITKANAVVSVSKASAITEFRTGGGDTIHLIVYEEAFDMLTDEQKNILIEGAISNVSYDSEKDRTQVDKSQYGELIRMMAKYPQYPTIIEIAQTAINQLAEQEKERKQAEREAKKQG